MGAPPASPRFDGPPLKSPSSSASRSNGHQNKTPYCVASTRNHTKPRYHTRQLRHTSAAPNPMSQSAVLLFFMITFNAGRAPAASGCRNLILRRVLGDSHLYVFVCGEVGICTCLCTPACVWEGVICTKHSDVRGMSPAPTAPSYRLTPVSVFCGGHVL
jgi:hypothetical protein